MGLRMDKWKVGLMFNGELSPYIYPLPLCVVGKNKFLLWGSLE